MMNLAIALSAWWQGIVAESHGYSTVLFLDCAVGGICLVTLPFLGAAIASRKNVQILLRPVVPSSR
jgi:predicted MFS family arabinose efflux permease